MEPCESAGAPRRAAAGLSPSDADGPSQSSKERSHLERAEAQEVRDCLHQRLRRSAIPYIGSLSVHRLMLALQNWLVQAADHRFGTPEPQPRSLTAR
jgi:hypothetical protein